MIRDMSISLFPQQQKAFERIQSFLKNDEDVFIDPFDYESGVDFPEGYEIKINDVKKKILKK